MLKEEEYKIDLLYTGSLRRQPVSLTSFEIVSTHCSVKKLRITATDITRFASTIVGNQPVTLSASDRQLEELVSS